MLRTVWALALRLNITSKLDICQTARNLRSVSVSTDTWKPLIVAFFFWEFWCRAEDIIFFCYDNNTTLTWCYPLFWVQIWILFILTTITARAKADRWGLPSSPFIDEETPPGIWISLSGTQGCRSEPDWPRPALWPRAAWVTQPASVLPSLCGLVKISLCLKKGLET